MRAFMVLSFGVLLSLNAISMVQCQNKNMSQESSPPSSQPKTAKDQAQKAIEFDCLPDGITLTDVVTYNRHKAENNVTVKDKLIELKAQCEDGKLVDDHHKEIRFFRLQCWGNPPADYQERQQRQQDELKELEKKYTVIIMGCDLNIQ